MWGILLVLTKARFGRGREWRKGSHCFWLGVLIAEGVRLVKLIWEKDDDEYWILFPVLLFLYI